jgi:hypothetical protein
MFLKKYFMRISAASHRDLKLTSERAFGIGFGVAFSCIGVAPMVTQEAGVRWWALAIAVAFLAAACLAPEILRPLRRAWFRLGPLLNRSLSGLVMGVLFFIVFVPVALVLRAIGKDILLLRGNPSIDSYWITRDPPGPVRGSMHEP